jgi:hypothetical protein
MKMKLNFSLVESLVVRNSESSDKQGKNVSVSSKETLDMLPIVTEWDSMIDDHPMIYLVGNKGGRDGQ